MRKNKDKRKAEKFCQQIEKFFSLKNKNIVKIESEKNDDLQQQIESIQLCDMQRQEDDGYYKILSEFFVIPEP